MTVARPTLPPVLVVGASGVIGGAVATALARAGHQVGLHYCSNRAAVERLMTVIGAEGGFARCYSSALTDAHLCRALADDFHADFPLAGGVALCAGRVPWRDWRALESDDWQSVFQEHCVAPAQLAIRALESWAPGCQVAYLSSISPKYGGSNLTLHYAAAKAALETTMLGLSRQTTAAGGRVNGVRAGFVMSPQQRQGRSEAEIAGRMGRIPIGRAILPEEIAQAVVYFLSPAAQAVTGQLLTVAGGD